MGFIEQLFSFILANKIGSGMCIATGFAFGSTILAIRLYLIKKPLHLVIALGASIFIFNILAWGFHFFFVFFFDPDISANLATLISISGGIVSFLSLWADDDTINEYR